jgi:TfoX/Sxy family transcriptional regulator of competence genes
MAYDEILADRIRTVLTDTADVTEQKMFGGLAFMVRRHMVCGVINDNLMLRLGPEGAYAALARRHVRPMDFTGRPMASMVYVEPAGLVDEALDDWVDAAVAHADQLPPKAKKPRRSGAGQPPLGAGRAPVR